MSNYHARMRFAFPLLVCILLLLTGCSRLFREEAPLRLYTLGSIVEEEIAVANTTLAGLSIGLRQPRLADYLATQFIVVRPHPNQVVRAPQHRWGGSLDREIGRALAEYLGASAPFERVDLVPWPAHAAYDYVVEVEVLHFEAVMPGRDRGGRVGEAHLRAYWEIIRVLDAAVVASGTTDRRQPGWPVEDYAALVSLLDDSLRTLADEMVAGLLAQR
jgi:uncharacterized lipoprotein YmbA